MTLFVKKIVLRNFRNYSNLTLNDLEKFNIVVGSNAVGKTNIIEAIQLTTAIFSLRNATTNQLIKWSSSKAVIETSIQDELRDFVIRLEIHNGKKTYYFNEKKKKPREIRDILPSICFAPDDLFLIKGSQSVKRNNLDMFGIQASANYQVIKKDYERILHHKNSLLKEEKKYPIHLFDSVNDMLATTGVQFFLYRKILLQKLIPYVKKHYKIITGGKEEVEVIYIPSWREIFCDADQHNDKDVETRDFKKALKIKHAEEIHRRYSLIGPHADRIEYRINGQDASIYGSQGQQRSLVLSIKLAEVEVLQDITKQKPVLLLDDVMSELDRERRESLIAFIQNDVQTFITTTHLEYFPQNILSKAHIITLTENLS